MEKSAIIIHKWGGSPDVDWYSWISKKLKKEGFKVQIPQMPNTEKPVIEEWVYFLENIINSTEGEIYLMGHSIGCQTVLRCLERPGKKIKAVFLIAPWLKINNSNLTQEEQLVAKRWAETPIDLEKVKKRCSNFVIVYSTTDPFSIITDIQMLQDKLHSHSINLGDAGHIEIKSLPILFEELLKTPNS